MQAYANEIHVGELFKTGKRGKKHEPDERYVNAGNQSEMQEM